jgi:hypothetical protein
MGEYAIRKSDRQSVKIGTCEEMLYLRWDDRSKVAAEPNSVDVNAHPEDLRYRLPYPDEDDTRPGDYAEPFRGLRLYRMVDSGRGSYCEDFADESLAEQPGSMQLTHPSGLLLNVPCYHGIKLPDVGPQARAFWNGKSHSLELKSVRSAIVDGRLQLFPVVGCRHCREQWRNSWDVVLPYIGDAVLRERLAAYARVGGPDAPGPDAPGPDAPGPDAPGPDASVLNVPAAAAPVASQTRTEPIGRDEAIAQIRAALKARGLRYSVRGGRGTAWGWIDVDLLPAVRESLADDARKQAYRELGDVFGLANGYDSISIASSSAHYREYIQRAKGETPAEIAQPYWD